MAMHAKKTHLYSLFVTIVRCRFCCARVFCVVFRQHQYFWPCGAVAFYGTSFIRKITALLSAKIKWLPFSETRHYTTILFKRSWFWLLEIRHNGRMCVCDFQASSAQSTAWMSKMVFFVSVDRLWSGVWGNSCSYTIDCDTINLQSVQLPHEQFNYLFYGIRYIHKCVWGIEWAWIRKQRFGCWNEDGNETHGHKLCHVIERCSCIALEQWRIGHNFQFNSTDSTENIIKCKKHPSLARLSHASHDELK